MAQLGDGRCARWLDRERRMGTRAWTRGRMTRQQAWGLVTLALLWALPAMATEQELLAAGQREFQRSCATCHGVDAKGQGPMAEFLTAKPADLTQLRKNHGGVFLFWRVYEEIEGSRDVVLRGHGTREMPIWGERFRLERSAGETHKAGVRGRILSLVYYLQSLQEP